MGIDELKQDAATMTRWQKHRFFILIAGVLLVAVALVALGLSMYKMSGAEQVDLSRPGYQSIQKEAQRGETTDDLFSASGALDSTAFDTFYKLYDKHASRVENTESFSEKALSEDSIQLTTPTAATPAQ